MHRPAFLSIALLLATTALGAYETFEVATIKPTPPEWTAGRYIRMQSANQLLAKNHTLKTLIAAAYNLSPQLISGGPAWVESDHYDIVARTPGEQRPNLDNQMLMLRNLLNDRFKLTFHRRDKEMPVYALTVAKSGLKLRPAVIPDIPSPAGPPALAFVLAPPLVRLPAKSATMGEFASVLQRAALPRPVLDQTGLTGRYDFDLEWAPDESQFSGVFGKATDETAAPGLFAAMEQQLGLKLEATKGTVHLFIIDKAERPSDN